MRERLKIKKQRLNSDRIKQIAQVLDALSYLNTMISDDRDDELSILLDSTYRILNVTYSNMVKIHFIQMSDKKIDSELLSNDIRS